MKTSLLLCAVLLLAFSANAQSARDFYKELYAAGGLDRFADEYVCFDEDATNQNFFIFGESKIVRDFMIQQGEFRKLPKEQQAELNKDWLIVHGYAKGIPFNGEEFYNKDGNSWISETSKLDTRHLVRIRLTVTWQTLRYKRSVEMLKSDLTFDSEIAHWGRCEGIKSDVRQTASP
jgi:hypothetical protein